MSAALPQAALRDLWHTAAPGRLSPWQQALALGLREASKEVYGGHVNVTWIASELLTTDSSGKRYSADAPQHGSLSEFFKKVDADADWYPGKQKTDKKRGPQPILTRAKRARIASSAMSQKGEGHEPSVDVTVARCPAATFNPETKKPFSDKTIRKVFLEECYDFDPAQPWKLQTPLQKIFLSDDVKAQRLSMARHILCEKPHGHEDNAGWWLRNVVWMDPCCSILPRSRQHYDRMRQAELGNRRRYISDDARLYSRNLRGRKESLKQATYEAERISWIIVVARGVVAVHMLPAEWKLNGEGMASVAAELPQILRGMLGRGAPLPRLLFTDRGTGMYAPSGLVVNVYRKALAEAGIRPYWGENAKQQAPDMGDMLLHETAVSWFRNRMRREKPVALPWEETRSQWAERAARCVRFINSENDVAGLCREFATRLQDCIDSEGERLRK